MADIFTFKILLVGDRSVGKTTYLKYLRTGVYDTAYIPTIGVNIHPIIYHTNYGKIIFNVWEVIDFENYCKDADACIYMYTYDNRSKSDIILPMENIPVIIVESKSDIVRSKISTIFHCKRNKDVTLSTHTHTNVNKVFLLLARALLNADDVAFV